MNTLTKREVISSHTRQSIFKRFRVMKGLLDSIVKNTIYAEKYPSLVQDAKKKQEIYNGISYPKYIQEDIKSYVMQNVTTAKIKKAGYTLKEAGFQIYSGDSAELTNRNNSTRIGDYGKFEDGKYYLICKLNTDKKVKPQTVINFVKMMWRDIKEEELDTTDMFGYVGEQEGTKVSVFQKDIVAKDEGTKWDVPFYEQLYNEIGIKRFDNLLDFYVFPLEMSNDMTYFEDRYLSDMGAKGGELYNLGGRINTSGDKGFLYRMKDNLEEYEDYSEYSDTLYKMMQRRVNEEQTHNTEQELICEGGAAGGLKHLYQDGQLTFGEMRQIFYDVFKGKTVLKEKCDGCNLMVTYKDGKFGFARNKSQLKEPIDIYKLGSRYDGNPKLKEAFVNSANDLTKAFESLDPMELNNVFQNGQNFANVEIIYPPCQNILDYGNKCMLQLNGINCYDSKFNKLSDNTEGAKWLYENLKNHKALKQEMFEITEPNILRIKNSVSAEKALNMLLEEFDKLIDGYSLKTSIQDYANDRLRRCAINVCNRNGIEVERDCQFIKELADRLSMMSNRRPTKSDICTFAKRCGVNVHSENYKNTINYLDENCDSLNEEIMRPIENIVMKAGTLLLKNLSGYMSCDPQKTSQKLVMELESTISEIEKDNSKLTSDKLKIFRRNMKKINEWQDRYMPSEGIVIKLNNGKCYKVVGSFGVVNQIMHLLDK